MGALLFVLGAGLTLVVIGALAIWQVRLWLRGKRR